QGSTLIPLTRNVVLPNGTKVNYKTGIVEFATGKKATLQEGDYVTLTGDVVIATPNNTTLPADGKSNRYVDKKQAPNTQVNGAVPATNDLPVLLSRKIQLLNDKISLMVPDPAKQDAINKINEQLLSLDAKLGR
ncbi:MAG TPA: DUF6799 domain-containing protein, partial [Hymenobacter sp.]|nr:DUF6799 domain-containing protein [Hymenobacter sp.]